MIRTSLRPLFCAVFFLGFVGCKSATPPPPPLSIDTIAVLLFDSESNNVDAPDIMQKLVYEALKGSRYRISDINETNAKLKEFGFIDGGQLGAIDETKLGRDLGVQALLFGNVESFGYTNVGVYVGRKVNLELKLVEVATGETLWENSGKSGTSRFAFDKETIQKNFQAGLAEQFVEKLFKSPLADEAKGSAVKALRTFPGFRFRGFTKKHDLSTIFKQDATKAIKKQLWK